MTDTDVRQYVMTPVDVSNAVIAMLESAKRDDWHLIGTGHPDLDAVTTLYPGSLTGVLGRPSHGKSMLCKAIAKRELERIRDADARDQCVVYVTLEEDPAVVGMALDGWDLSVQDVTRGRFDLPERRRAAQYITKRPVFMVRHPGLVDGKMPPALTPALLYRAIESIAEDYPSDPKAPKFKPTLVVLDYVQLLQADDLPMSERKKTAQVTAAIEGAKNLAMRLSVPVVMAVQAGRQTDSHADQMPAMADAQWASAIEQACDVVLGVHRPCRRDDLADKMRSGQRVHVTLNGQSFAVNDSLMVIGLIKQRAGIGYGRFPAYLDPVGLTMHGIDRHA